MNLKETLLQALAFKKPARPAGLPPVKFFREAAYFGEHGRIVVSSVKYGLHAQTVALVFVGKIEAPELDLTTMQYIWDQALEQGFVPHCLEQYGSSNEIQLRTMANKSLTQPEQPADLDIEPVDTPAVFRTAGRVVSAS